MILAVLLIIVLLIGAVAGFTVVNASKNMKVMNSTLDAGMETLSGFTEVTPVDAGEYSEIKMYGIMKFDVSQYDIKDLGNLSVEEYDDLCGVKRRVWGNKEMSRKGMKYNKVYIAPSNPKYNETRQASNSKSN